MSKRIKFPKGYKIVKNPNPRQTTDLWIITYPDGKRFYDKGDIELDFETKEMIFNKLLSIVSESNTNQQTH